MIRLAGYVPDEDIEVAFTGIRPGEKLFEELVGHDEIAEASEVEKVQIVHALCQRENGDFMAAIDTLEGFALAGDDAAVMRGLQRMVPSLCNSPMPEKETTPIQR